jgi:hypothetical protein
MIIPDTPVTTSSSIPTEDTTVLDNLESHCKGELPGVISEKASEVASMKVASESPHHQSPTPQIPQPTQQNTILESVPVTKSKPYVSVPDSEPIQHQKLSVSDQPSSLSDIQILEQPPSDILNTLNLSYQRSAQN